MTRIELYFAFLAAVFAGAAPCHDNEDAMETGKLAERIRKFSADARRLQQYALSQMAAKVG